MMRKLLTIRAAILGVVFLATLIATKSKRLGNSEPDLATGVKRLEQGMKQVSEWGSTSDYPEDSWRRLRVVARELQSYSPKFAKDVISRYQASDNGQYGKEDFQKDGKLYLLMRVMFKLPEQSRESHVLFGGWMMPQGSYEHGELHNLGWPVTWKSGNPALESGYFGLQGSRYNATAEFDYFQSKYSFRK